MIASCTYPLLHFSLFIGYGGDSKRPQEPKARTCVIKTAATFQHSECVCLCTLLA